ncbi:death-associated inhibitor of apoptosis 2-like [Lineus longissimus]|uniref:death-associated inhibitor of apoptosis 2-like n=1 Tax=Lineus longissimus TaxID=88925 RepID=UPI00315CCC75
MRNGAVNEYTSGSIERDRTTGKKLRITHKTENKDGAATNTPSLKRNHGNVKHLDTKVVCDGSSDEDEEDLYGEPSHGFHLQSSASNVYHSTDARHPRFSDKAERTFSFGTWDNAFRCSVTEAAEAGLFYPGGGRDLLCHYCGIAVPPLKRSDDAWIEHAKANPRCAFVLSSKGERFVRMVREMYDSFEMDDSTLERELMELDDSQNVRKPQQSQASVAQQTAHPTNPVASTSRELSVSHQPQTVRASDTARTSTARDPLALPRQTQPVPPLPASVQGTTRHARAQRPPRIPKRQVQAREVRARLDMEWAQRLIGMGFSADLVGAVIAEQMIYNGDDFKSYKDMLMATVEAADMGDDYPVRHYALGLAQNPAMSSRSEGSSTSQQTPFTTPRSGSSSSTTSSSNFAMALSVGASSWTETTAPTGGNPGNSSAIKNIETSVGNLSLETQILEKENRELKDKQMCKICYERDANIVFIPCGHLVVCQNCNIRINECPLCRKGIRGTLKAFLS